VVPLTIGLGIAKVERNEWMASSLISFRLVPDVRQGHGRAVGILEGHPDLCADVLLNLPKKDGDYQKYSMDRWASGIDGPQSRCHKFDGTEYFVFKDTSKQHRFYGFLFHPLLNTNARFLLCVLTTYANKKEDNTDQADLNRVGTWMNVAATKAAIKLVYPDVLKKSEKE
jgi:hypothetical protein